MSEVFGKELSTEITVDFDKLNPYETEIFLNFIQNEDELLSELSQIGAFAFCSREIRKLHKITQKELSKEIKVAENTIYNYENGKTEPSKKTKEIVKNKLCISDYFLELFYKIENDFFSEIEEKKKEILKDSQYTEVILSKLNKYKEDTVFRNIFKEILKEKILRFEKINDIINAYIMISSNPAIIIDLVENHHLEIFYGLDTENLSENTLIYPITTNDFIYKILLPISENTKNIFINNNTTRSNFAVKKEIQKELNKQYTKLEKFFDNKEGGSNE